MDPFALRSVPGVGNDIAIEARTQPDGWLEPAPETGLGGEFVSGVGRGIDQTQELLYGITGFVGDLTGSTKLLAVARRGLEQQGEDQARNPAQVGSLDEIDGVGDFFKWSAGALGEATPLVAAAGIQGGLGAAASRRLFEQGIRRGMFAEAEAYMTQLGYSGKAVQAAIRNGMRDPLVQKQLRQAVMKRTTKDLFVSSSVLGVGEAQGELMDANVSSPGAALGAGLTMGALDTAPGMMFLSKFFPGVEPKLAKSFIKEVLGETAKGIPAEGVTEGLQEATLLAARAFADPSFDLGDPANKDRILEAMAAGALVGSVMGGGSTTIAEGPGALKRAAGQKAINAWTAAKARKDSFMESVNARSIRPISERLMAVAKGLSTNAGATAPPSLDPRDSVKTDVANYFAASMDAVVKQPLADIARITKDADELFSGSLPAEDIESIVTAVGTMSDAIDLEVQEPLAKFVAQMKVELDAALEEAMKAPAAEQQARLDEVNATFKKRVDQFKTESISPLVKKYSDQLAKYLQTAPLSDPTIKDMGPDEFEDAQDAAAGVDEETRQARSSWDDSRLLSDVDAKDQLVRTRFGMSGKQALTIAGRRTKNQTELAQERIKGQKQTIVDKFTRDDEAIPFNTRGQAEKAIEELQVMFPELDESAFTVQEEDGGFYPAILDAMQSEVIEARVKLHEGFELARLSAREIKEPAERLSVRWPETKKARDERLAKAREAGKPPSKPPVSRVDAKKFAETGALIYERESGEKLSDPVERAVIGFETVLGRMAELGTSEQPYFGGTVVAKGVEATERELLNTVIRVDKAGRKWTYGDLRELAMDARNKARDSQPLGFEEEQSEEDKAEASQPRRRKPSGAPALGQRSDAPKKGKALKGQNEFYEKLYQKQLREAKKKMAERDEAPVFDRGADPFFTPASPPVPREGVYVANPEQVEKGKPAAIRVERPGTTTEQRRLEMAGKPQPDRFLDNVRNPNLDARTLDARQAIDMPGSEFAQGKKTTEADRNKESTSAPIVKQSGGRVQRDQVAYVRLDSVSDQTQADVIDLVETFREVLGLKDRIEVFDTQAVGSAMFDEHPFGELLRQAAADPSVTARVFMHPTHGVTIYISNKMVSEHQQGVSPEVARQRTYRALAHELGHVVFEVYYHKLSRDLQTKLQRAAPEGVNFEEWAADQLVVWAVDRNRKTRNAVDSFFKRVVDKLYEFYQRVRAKYKLNDTFAEFVDGVAQYALLGPGRHYRNEFAAAFAHQNVLGSLRNSPATPSVVTKDLGDLVVTSQQVGGIDIPATIAAHEAAKLAPAAVIRRSGGADLTVYDERSDKTKDVDKIARLGAMVAELTQIGGVADLPMIVSIVDGARAAKGPYVSQGMAAYGGILNSRTGLYMMLPEHLLRESGTDRSGGRAFYVAGHEVGHTVFRRFYQSSPPEVRKALVRAGLKAIFSEGTGVTLPGFPVQNASARPVFQKYADKIEARTPADTATVAQYLDSVAAYIEEWMATQFPTLIADAAARKSFTPETQTFFKRMNGVMQKIFEAMKRFFRPTESYRDFLRQALRRTKAAPVGADKASVGSAFGILAPDLYTVIAEDGGLPEGAPEMWRNISADDREGFRVLAEVYAETAMAPPQEVGGSGLNAAAGTKRPAPAAARAKGSDQYEARRRRIFAERVLRRIKRKIDANPSVKYMEELGMGLFDQTIATVAGQLRRMPGGERLADIFFRVRGQVSTNSRPTFYNRMQRFRAEMIAKGIEIFKGVPEADIEAAYDELWNATTGRTTTLSPLAQKIQDFYFEAYKAGRKSGLPLLFRKNYIPVMWGNKQLLLDDEAKILAHITSQYTNGDAQQAKNIFNSLVHGLEEQINFDPGMNDKIDTPSGRFFKHRHKMLSDPFFKPYLEKDLRVGMVRYIHALSNAAVFNEYFGEEAVENDPDEFKKTGEKFAAWDPRAKLKGMLEQMAKAGATAAQIRRTKDLVDAALGRYGRDFPANVRTAMGWVLTYQNMRTLLFGTLSSFPDIVGPGIRADNMRLAWNTLRTHLKEIVDKNSDLNQLARTYGIYSDEFQNNILSYDYDNHWFSPLARNINDKMFTAIGLHRWTNFTRSVGMRVGMEFINERAHKALQGDPTAIHDLAQLNLSVDDVRMWLDGGAELPGQATYSKVDPVAKAVDDKVVDALIQFTNESVMKPDPSQRPLWASHPAAMLIFHLHQFMYLFQNTVMGQMLVNARAAGMGVEGAMRLAGPAMLMMLMTAVGLELRELLQYHIWGKSAPTDNQDSLEYLTNLAQRTGFLGVGQYAADFFEAHERGNNAFIGLLGPTVEQVNGMLADPWQLSMARALPVVNQLPPVRQAVGGI